MSVNLNKPIRKPGVAQLLHNSEFGVHCLIIFLLIFLLFYCLKGKQNLLGRWFLQLTVCCIETWTTHVFVHFVFWVTENSN